MTALRQRLREFSESPRLVLRALFALLAAEALVALLLAFAEPSQSGSGLFLAYSAIRWLLGLLLLGIGLACAWLARAFWRNRAEAKRLQNAIQTFLEDNSRYLLLLLALALLSLAGLYLFLISQKATDALLQARLQRLSPLLIWLSLFSIQSLIALPLLRRRRAVLDLDRKIWLPTALAALGLFAVVILVGETRLGLAPDRTGWDTPGVPLLATQVLLAWLAAVLLWSVLRRLALHYEWRLKRIDLLLAGLVWLAAVLLWQSQPLTPTYFSPTPQPPNSAFYPYSDAGLLDLIANNFLVGEGFHPVAEKPLYSFFLAGLHLLVGQDYLRVIFLQVLVLAIFPVTLYFLGSRLHHRFSGLLLAGAVILRERNAIALSGEINVSHSKLMMTDFPAALALALFTLLLLKWLDGAMGEKNWPLFIGGSLGIILLLRSQALIFLPMLLLIALLCGGNWRLRFRLGTFLLLGFALAALPWMLRNYRETGQFGYSQPLQARYLAKQYSLTPEDNDPGFPDDTPASEYVSRGFANVGAFVRQYPGEVVRFVSAHTLHNEISSLLALPIRFNLSDKLIDYYNLSPYWQGAEAQLWRTCCSLNAHIADTPYWSDWDGDVPRDAYLPLVANLAIVALGIGAAWRRMGALTLIPLAIHIGYSFSSAIARVSGWRLILPADWVLLLFYCLGLGQLTFWLWSYFSARRQPDEVSDADPQRVSRLSRLSFGWLALSILAAGSLLPAAELLLPATYERVDAKDAQTAWDEASFANQPQLDLADFLEQPGAFANEGRALWPRFYVAGAGEPGGQWPAFNPLPFNRLGFALVGPQGGQYVLPLQSAPAAFPNGADVLVIGCFEGDYYRVIGVLFQDGGAPDLLSDRPNAFVCSPTS